MRTLAVFGLLVTTLFTAQADAAKPVFESDFRLHDFDQAILDVMGHDSAYSIVYFRELASINESQARERRTYEPIGCHPFYLMKNGKVEERGYNCQSFFCTGYSKGPKICRHIEDKAYGGVVEINRRLSLVTLNDARVRFADYREEDRSDAMNKRIEDLRAVRCHPYYLQEFDIVVGEGYDCEELGRYPHYSGAFRCETDTRNKEGQVCSQQLRSDEMDMRANLAIQFPAKSSSSSAGSSQSVSSQSSSSMPASSSSSISSSEASSSVSSVPPVTFPDVVEGRYGYTAIVSLATQGIIKGYADGTYRPKNIMNRAEFSKVLMEGLHAGLLTGELRCFPDVRDEWFSSSVCAARRYGWVKGYTNGNFHPERTMKKAEAIKVIVESLGGVIQSDATLPVGTPEGQWYTPYVRTAVDLGLILEPNFSPMADVTRADAAVWMYRAQK